MNILTINVRESSLQNNLESEIILMWNFKVVDQFLNPNIYQRASRVKQLLLSIMSVINMEIRTLKSEL